MDIQTKFGKRLAQLRKARGWSQEALAFESGLARSYLGGVERGLHNISIVNIGKLAEAMKMKPAELMTF